MTEEVVMPMMLPAKVMVTTESQVTVKGTPGENRVVAVVGTERAVDAYTLLLALMEVALALRVHEAGPGRRLV